MRSHGEYLRKAVWVALASVLAITGAPLASQVTAPCAMHHCPHEGPAATSQPMPCCSAAPTPVAPVAQQQPAGDPLALAHDSVAADAGALSAGVLPLGPSLAPPRGQPDLLSLLRVLRV